MSVGWALSTLILDLSSFFSCWSFWFSRLLSFFLCFHDNLVLFGFCTMLNITKTQHLSSFVKFYWISFETRFLINFVTKIIFGIFLGYFWIFLFFFFESLLKQDFWSILSPKIILDIFVLFSNFIQQSTNLIFFVFLRFLWILLQTWKNTKITKNI